MRASRIRLMSHQENTHWLVHTSSQRIVLRRYASEHSHGDVAYKLRPLEHLDRQGWPMPVPVSAPLEMAGSIWYAFGYMPGRAPVPRSVVDVHAAQHRALTVVLDFDLAHLDLRVADFAVSWRGQYDEVVRGYEEVSPLD